MAYLTAMPLNLLNNMKLIPVLFILVLLSCNQTDTTTVTTSDSDTSLRKDSGSISKDPLPADRTEVKPLSARDSSFVELGEEVLIALEDKDYKKLSSFVHPRSGVLFSAHAFVDTTDNTRLSAAQLADPAMLSRKVNWGAFEPNDTITIGAYFNKFVYDVDFLNAEIKSVNSFHSRGTDLNNIKEAFPGTDIVEFYFPGFDPKYEGMDFRGLRLVFKTENNKRYLVGIVHDQWTP